jgi:hypothetical protein
MIQRKPPPAILAKYPVRMPNRPISEPLREYARMKDELWRKHGHIPAREYDEWIAVVVEELGI